MTLREASEQVQSDEEVASLFYERGFYGLVWFEGATRHVRDLKNW